MDPEHHQFLETFMETCGNSSQKKTLHARVYVNLPEGMWYRTVFGIIIYRAYI